MVWISVFVEAIRTINEKPEGKRNRADSQKYRDKENKTRLALNPAAA
jgi:hypothetical protein